VAYETITQTNLTILSALQEGIKSLCTHIVEGHMADLEHVDYVNTFESLKANYEQDRVKDKTGVFDGYSVRYTAQYCDNRFKGLTFSTKAIFTLIILLLLCFFSKFKLLYKTIFFF